MAEKNITPQELLSLKAYHDKRISEYEAATRDLGGVNALRAVANDLFAEAAAHYLRRKEPKKGKEDIDAEGL